MLALGGVHISTSYERAPTVTGRRADRKIIRCKSGTAVDDEEVRGVAGLEISFAVTQSADLGRN